MNEQCKVRNLYAEVNYLISNIRVWRICNCKYRAPGIDQIGIDHQRLTLDRRLTPAAGARGCARPAIQDSE